MAGISFFRDRSPVTPKTTRAHGSGMRGRRRSRGSRRRLVGAESRSLMSRSFYVRSLAARRRAALGRAAAAVAADRLALVLELLGDGVDELVPGVFELLDALVLEHQHDVVVVDPDFLDPVQHALGVAVMAADGVRLDLAVVVDRL